MQFGAEGFKKLQFTLCEHAMYAYMYNVYILYITGLSANVVATVGGAGRACPEPTIFAQHSEQNTLCCLTHISPGLIQNIVHCALI